MTLRNALALAMAVAMFASGWLVESWRMEREIARLQGAQAKAEAAAEKAHSERLADANSRGDQLALQLAGYQETLSAFAEEKNREIARLTTGRRCLDSAAVRLLNQPSGLKLGGLVPEAAGIVVRTDAAAPADPDDRAFASDGDVASWITTCQTRYDACRGRLQAIADFYKDSE